MIKVYGPDTRSFPNNGLGTVETVSCIETKKLGLNGWFITVTAKSEYADLLRAGRIVLADTKEHGFQPFRINNPEIIDRRLKFKANHVVFDAETYILEDSRPTNLGAVEYLRWVNAATDNESPFIISGDYTEGSATTYFVRKTLLEAFATAQQVFGCIIDPVGFDVRAMKQSSVGKNNGYSVAYGRNIQGVEITEDWSEVATKIMPVGTNGVTLPEVYLYADIEYDTPYTKVVKFNTTTRTEESGDVPIEQQMDELRSLGAAYLEEHKTPNVVYKIKSDVPQELNINDVVSIKHPQVNLVANVLEYTFDCDTHKVKSLVFGNYEQQPADRLLNTINDRSVTAATEISQETASAEITHYDKGLGQLIDMIINGLGLYKTTTISPNGGHVYYYHSSPRMEDSEIIYTFNSNGLAVSRDGGETWVAGLDADGNAVVNMLSAVGVSADWISTGELDGRLIRAGSILTAALEVMAAAVIEGSNENFSFLPDGLHIARKDSSGRIISEYRARFGDMGMRVLNNIEIPTLIAEGDTVWAVNMTADNFLSIVTRVTEPGTAAQHSVADRLQGFWSNSHNEPMMAAFWEE